MGRTRIVGNTYNPYATDSRGRQLDGRQRLQTKREYFEYSDLQLFPSYDNHFVIVRSSGSQSGSWSIVTQRHENHHGVSQVRNGAYCQPYWQSGAYRGRPDEQPDYYLIMVRQPDGSYVRYAHDPDFDKAMALGRRIARQFGGDGKLDEVRTARNDYQQKLESQTWHKPAQITTTIRKSATKLTVVRIVRKAGKKVRQLRYA